MAEFEFVDGGAFNRVAASLTRTGVTIGAKAFLVTRQFGILLQTRVKANAAGRPGPRMVTGDYNRSILLQTSQRGSAVEAVVGTNKPQGPRLELGFVGEDSLGRTYNQPPYEHFGPAADQTGPEWQRAVGEMASGTVAEAISDATGRGPL